MPFTITIAPWILIPLYPGWIKRLVRLGPGLVLTHGTVLGEYAGRQDVFGPYDPTATDGRQTARSILEVDCCTDASGYVTLASTTPGAGPAANEPRERVPVFEAGTFATAELIGLDSQAVSQLGRLVQGTVTQGICRLP